MRATEIIRGILDLIDEIEANRHDFDKSRLSSGKMSHDVEAMVRYEQIQDLLPDLSDALSSVKNTPNPKIADISAVTTQTGTDLNKSKNPSDIRGEHISMYPHYQYNPKE